MSTLTSNLIIPLSSVFIYLFLQVLCMSFVLEKSQQSKPVIGWMSVMIKGSFLYTYTIWNVYSRYTHQVKHANVHSPITQVQLANIFLVKMAYTLLWKLTPKIFKSVFSRFNPTYISLPITKPIGSDPQRK